MAISCEELVSFADGLKGAADEVSYRAAVSRAYYGAFHKVDNWHANLPVKGHNIGPAGGRHQVLLNQLTHPDASIPPATQILSRSLGYALLALRALRTKADYDIHAAMTPEDAANACAQAKQLLAKAV